MSERAPYSRVYWSIVDDPKFSSIYDDDRHLATWLRLLIAADAIWPASCPIPGNARKGSVSALVDAGLIDLGTGYRFRVHGLDAERGRRRDAARTPPKRGPDGTQTVPERDLGPGPKTRRDELRQAEPSNARESLPAEDGRDDLEAFMLITRKAPTTRQRALLDGLLDRHDLTGPKWAADIMLRHPDDPIGAVIEADKAWRAERIAEAQAAERPKPQPRRSKGIPEHSRELLAHWEAEKRAEAESRKEPVDAPR